MILATISDNRPRYIVRPQRVILIALLLAYSTARATGAITIKGYCPEHDVEFELPSRREAPFKVKCPVGGESILRVVAIRNYIKHKRGGS